MEFKVGDKVRVIPELVTPSGRVVPTGSVGRIWWVGGPNEEIVICRFGCERAFLKFNEIERLTPAAIAAQEQG